MAEVNDCYCEMFLNVQLAPCNVRLRLIALHLEFPLSPFGLSDYVLYFVRSILSVLYTRFISPPTVSAETLKTNFDLYVASLVVFEVMEWNCVFRSVVFFAWSFRTLICYVTQFVSQCFFSD